MNPDDDDDIDPDAKMRVTGKLEAHFPDFPNPEDYGHWTMDMIVSFMREQGLTFDVPNLMQIPRAARQVTNFFQQGENANRWGLRTLDSHDGVIESSPTGRTIKSEPQPQQIPLDTTEVKNLRKAWIEHNLTAPYSVHEFSDYDLRFRNPYKQGQPMTGKDIREFNAYLAACTDRQVQGVYEKEKAAGRDEYVALAEAEAAKRGIVLEG